MLNYFEQRQLRAIERSLETEDPALAERIRNARATPSAGNDLKHVSAVGMVGAVLAVVGLVVSPTLTGLGTCMAVIAFTMRLVLGWVAREDDGQQSTPDQDGD